MYRAPSIEQNEKQPDYDIFFCYLLLIRINMFKCYFSYFYLMCFSLNIHNAAIFV